MRDVLAALPQVVNPYRGHAVVFFVPRTIVRVVPSEVCLRQCTLDTQRDQRCLRSPHNRLSGRETDPVRPEARQS